MTGIICISVFIILIAIECLLLIYNIKDAFFHRENKTVGNISSFSEVTILMSVRDEERTISQSIHSLLNQTYPNFTIKIGDDSSTDSTRKLLRNIDSERLFVNEFDDRVSGKAEILSELSKNLETTYLAVADGDTVYNPGWLQAMVSSIGGSGVISGVTGVKDHAMQDLEWITTTNRISLATKLGFTTTAIGNNMFMNYEVYKSVGGFEAVKNYITEDFAINREIVKKGFKSKIRFKDDVLAFTHSVAGTTFIYQRKRWLTGMSGMNLPLKLSILLYGLLLPIMVLGLWQSFTAFKYLIPVFLLLKIFSEFLAYRIVGRRINFMKLLVFQFYQLVMSVVMLVFYKLPMKNKWKGRDW